MNNDDWKISWEKYLAEKHKGTVPWEEQSGENGPIKIDLGDIDFYIPPLLGTTPESMKAIQKHNAKHRIFS
jgi:hypothetical protein